MSVGFLDLVRVTLSTTGTGSTLTIAAAVAGWLDFTGAGGVNGTIYRYAIIDGNNSEIGTATYNSGTNTLAGRTVTKSTNSNAPLNLTSAAILAVSVAAEDLNIGGTNYGTMAGQSAAAVTITGGTISGLSSFSSSQIGIGTISPDSPLTINANTGATAAPPSGTLAHIIGGASNAHAAILLDTYGTGIPKMFGRVAGGTQASPTAVPSGQQLIQWQTEGWDGSAYGLGPAFFAFTQEAWSGTAHGGYWSFFTTIPTTTTLHETMRLWGSGGVAINSFATDPGAGNLSIQGGITAFNATTFQPQLTMWNQTADANAGSFIVQKSRAASGAGSAVQVGDAIGTFAFRGNDSAGTVQNAAFITSLVTAVGSGFVTGNLFLSGSVINFGGPTLQNFASPTTALYTSQVFGNALNTVEVTNDNLALGASINYDSAVYHVFGGSSVTGGRCGSLSFLGITAPTSPSNTIRDYTGGAWGIIANSTGDNGTNTTPFGGGAGAKGALIAGNIYSQIFGTSGSPASNWLTVAGLEIDCFGTTNVSMAYNWALSLVSINAVRGSALDAALVVYSGAQSFWGPGAGFQNGVCFAEVDGNGLTPISSTGSLISGSVGTLSTIPVAYGCDFRNFTFTNFAVRSTSGIYGSAATVQTSVGACIFPQGSGGYGSIGGALGTPSTSGNAGTYFVTGYGNSDGTQRIVPYSSAGALLGTALTTTFFAGSTSPGSGDPSPQGSTTAGGFSIGKASASGGSGTGVYGQTGGMWINAIGGWNGSALTFTRTGVSWTGAVTTITVPAAPTSHAYVQGMPVTGTGIQAGTVIVTVNSGTSITLSKATTGTQAGVTLTFTAGGSTSINPQYGGTPGDTFAINGQVSLYDNGFGVAQFLECVISQYAVGAGTPTYSMRLQVGSTSGSALGSFGHMIGYLAAAEVLPSANGVAFAAKTDTTSSWGLFGATDAGGSYSMTGTVSDPKIKKNVKELGSVRSIIAGIHAVEYEWDDYYGSFLASKDYHHFGFLSEDGHGLSGVKHALHRHGYGPERELSIWQGIETPRFGFVRSIDYHQMSVFLWRGMQEVWAETEVLLDRMNGLEARVSVLEGRPAVQ